MNKETRKSERENAGKRNEIKGGETMRNEKKKVSSRIVGLLLGALIVLGAGKVAQLQAASSADIDLKVTIASDLQIGLVPGVLGGNATSYNFGVMTVNVTTITNVAVSSNTSSANIETFGAGLTDPVVWTADTAAGADKYNLRVVFTTNSLTTEPAGSEFASNDDVSAGSPVKATSTIFAPATADNGNGVSVPNLGGDAQRRRRIWVRLVTPTSSSTGLEQNIKLTVNAQLP